MKNYRKTSHHRTRNIFSRSGDLFIYMFLFPLLETDTAKSRKVKMNGTSRLFSFNFFLFYFNSVTKICAWCLVQETDRSGRKMEYAGNRGSSSERGAYGKESTEREQKRIVRMCAPSTDKL